MPFINTTAMCLPRLDDELPILNFNEDTVQDEEFEEEDGREVYVLLRIRKEFLWGVFFGFFGYLLVLMLQYFYRQQLMPSP